MFLPAPSRSGLWAAFLVLGCAAGPALRAGNVPGGNSRTDKDSPEQRRPREGVPVEGWAEAFQMEWEQRKARWLDAVRSAEQWDHLLMDARRMAGDASVPSAARLKAKGQALFLEGECLSAGLRVLMAEMKMEDVKAQFLREAQAHALRARRPGAMALRAMANQHARTRRQPAPHWRSIQEEAKAQKQLGLLLELLGSVQQRLGAAQIQLTLLEDPEAGDLEELEVLELELRDSFADLAICKALCKQVKRPQGPGGEEWENRHSYCQEILELLAPAREAAQAARARLGLPGAGAHPGRDGEVILAP